MRFTYDLQLESLSVLFSEKQPVLQHIYPRNDMILLEIDGEGSVCRIQIDKPHLGGWFTDDLIYEYKLDINQAYLLITLFDNRHLFFRME